LVVLADALLAQGRAADASEALVAASDAQGGSPDLLARAASIAPRELLGGLLDRAALDEVASRELRAFAEGSDVASPSTPRGWLARAEAALVAGAPSESLSALDAWETSRPSRVDEPLAAELRRRA